MDDVKGMQIENDRLKKQIEDLKSRNEVVTADKNALDIKYNSANINA